MAKHLKHDKPSRPNTILDVGATPVPEGVELRVVVRLEDAAYNVAKVFETEQLEYILDGLRLALETAKYKQRPVPSIHKKQAPAAGSEPAAGPPPSPSPPPPLPPNMPPIPQRFQPPQ